MIDHTKHNNQKVRTFTPVDKHPFDKKSNAIHTLQFISPPGRSIFEDGFPCVLFAEQFDKIRGVVV